MSLPPAFEPWWEQLSRFQLQYPDIQLQVYTTERCIDLIEDGIDVALRVGTITHEAMVVRRALEDRHLLVASAQPRSRRRRRDSAPPFLAADAIRAGDLVELLPQFPLPQQQIHLLYPSHRHPSLIIRTYLAFCLAEILLISKDWLQQGEVRA